LKRNADTGKWEDVGDDVAREKASQVLRDAVGEKSQAEKKPSAPEKVTFPLRESEMETFYSDPTQGRYSSSSAPLPYAPYRPPQAAHSTAPRRPEYQWREASSSRSLDDYYVQPRSASTMTPLSYATPVAASSRSKRPHFAQIVSSTRSLDEYYYSEPLPHPTPTRRHSTDELDVRLGSSSLYQHQDDSFKRRRATSSQASYPPQQYQHYHQQQSHQPTAATNLNEFDLLHGELLKSDCEDNAEDLEDSGTFSI